MKSRTLWILLWALILGALPLQGTTEPVKPLPVVVTIPPLASWMEAIGGPRVQVMVLIPPGADPHTYEPRPSQLRSIHHAKVFVRVGLHLEASWTDRVLSSLSRDSVWIVSVGPMVSPLGHPPNPHVWLSLVNAVQIVDSLSRLLARLDPEGAGFYERRAQAFIQEALTLHHRYQEAFDTLVNRSFLAQHSTWAYLARDYGLQQVAVLSMTPGQEPGPRKIAEILHEIRQLRVPLLIVEPQLPRTLPELLHREIRIRLVELDPLGILPGHRSYLQMMRDNLETLFQAFLEAQK